MRKAEFTMKASPKFNDNSTFRVHILPRSCVVFSAVDQEKVESISGALAKLREEVWSTLSAELHEQKKMAKKILASYLERRYQTTESGEAEANVLEERGEPLRQQINQMVASATENLEKVPDKRGKQRLWRDLNEEINDYLDLKYQKQYFLSIKKTIENENSWTCSIEAF